MPISLNGIPDSIRTPGQYIGINNSRAVSGAPAKPHKCLIIGQKTTAGTVAALTPVAISSDKSGDGFFGARSQLAAMCRAFKKANRFTEVYAMAQDDGGGSTAGTKTLTVTGPATADGVIYGLLGGREFQVVVKNGDTANTIATNINTQIQGLAYYPYAPFTSGVATNVVTLTQANKGTIGNGYDVRFNYGMGQAFPAGVSVAVAAGVTGAVDPDLQAALDVIDGEQYDTIIVSHRDSTNIAKLGNYLTTQWGPMIMKEGMGYAAVVGTQSAMTAIGNALNFFPICVLEIGGVVNGSPTPTWEAAATFGAVCAFEATVDPARPLQDIVLPGILPPAIADRFNRDERDIILTDGLATHVVDPAGNVRLERAITTYQTNSLGIPDPSYLDSETPRTLAQLRFEVRAMIELKYPRHKLADDGTIIPPGQAVVTPGTIRAEIIGLARSRWEGRWIEGMAQFKADLLVERNITDRNRVDSRIVPDLINQFRVFAGELQYLL